MLHVFQKAVQMYAGLPSRVRLTDQGLDNVSVARLMLDERGLARKKYCSGWLMGPQLEN